MDFPTRASTLVLLLLAVSASAAAQSGRLSRPMLGVELGASTPALLVRDANGTKLHLGVGPVLGGLATWSLSPRLRSVVGVRFSITTLDGNQDRNEWDAGRATIASAHVGLSGAIHQRLAISGALGPTWLSGPDDVVPFESATSALHWGGEAGVAWRVTRARPISALLSLEAFSLGGANAGDPVAESGWVRRFVMGVRYGA